MLYFSLALIALGLLIFVYSIIVDAKGRRSVPDEEGRVPDMPPPRRPAPHPVDRPSTAPVRAPSGGPSVRPGPRLRPSRPGQAPPAEPSRGLPDEPKRPPAAASPRAVLYEDGSRIIDYDSESGSIDPTLDGYRDIRRIGDGRFSVEKGGITFLLGKKLYRYDFHRMSDLKAGSRHLALFLQGSESVKLFIFDPGSGLVAEAARAYQEFLKGAE